MATFYLLKTITFPTYTIDAAGNTIHVVMKTYDTENNPEAVNAIDKNMSIINYGKLTYEYDMDDPFLVPSGMDMAVFDPDEYLADFLFGTPLTLPAEKRYSIEVYLYYNSDIIFGGDTIEDAVEYNVGTKILRLKIANAIDKINSLSLYDVSDSALDPLGWGPTYWRSFQSMFDDIFQVINSACSTTITHGWRWEDKFGNASDWELDQMDIDVTTWFNSFGSWQAKGSVGDFLRQLCFEFDAYAGMSTWGTAFFSQVINFGATSTATILDADIISLTKAFGYSKKKYIGLQSRDAVTGGAGVFADEGDDSIGGISGQIIERDITAYTQSAGISNGELLRVTAEPLWFMSAVTGTRDVWGNSIKGDQVQVLADKLYRTRALAAMTRRDRFVVFGIDYTFPLIFTYDGIDYQSTKMVKDFTNHTTTIEAFQMPDLS